jgi:two-component system, NarL family, response regulator
VGEAHVIVLTTYDGDEDIYRALQTGAQAYLLKDTPRAELLEAIRAVARGQKRLPPEVAARLMERMSSEALTEREIDVLRLMARGRSNKAIGAELAISEGTVKFHVVNILGKLGADDRTQAVTIALQRGIIHLDEPLR